MDDQPKSQYGIPIPGPGRDTSCTPEKIKEICGYLEKGGTITDACLCSGIERKTFYNWKERGEAGEEPFAAFLRASDCAQAKARQYMTEVLQAATADPKGWNPKPAMWFLERRDRTNWGPQVEVKQTTTVVSADDILKELQDETHNETPKET